MDFSNISQPSNAISVITNKSTSDVQLYGLIRAPMGCSQDSQGLSGPDE
jgi:hypothetical protein